MTNLKKSKKDTLRITSFTPKIGAHLSINGGYANALLRAKEIGANCLQIFSTSPRNWGRKLVTPQEIENFLELKSKLKIDPVYFHASYLVNLADGGRIGQLSIDSLIDELNNARKLDVKGTVIHLGSFKGQKANYDLLLKNINAVLENTPEETLFIIENAGNKKICCKFSELWYIVSKLNNKRVRVCLDTCHLWAAGYDLSTKTKFNSYFSEFDNKIGLENLEAFQVNDSKDYLGSYRDRHENLEEGNIPIEEFKILMTDERTKNLPMILEVPGADKKGPTKESVSTLKAYI